MDIEPWVAILPSALVIVEVVSSTVDFPEGPADSRNIDSWVAILPSSLAIFFRNVDKIGESAKPVLISPEDLVEWH